VIDRPLGRTGLRVSAIAFGAGPVSGLMTGTDHAAQRATVQRAVGAGINWFDTAPGYGNGQSEVNLGRMLEELGIAGSVHIATKVRVPPEALDNPGDYIRQSAQGSLRALGVPRLTLLQLHNGITRKRDDEPASISPGDILGAKGVARSFQRLQEEGLIAFLGLTGTGQAETMSEVIRSGAFDTLQVPFNILNPSAGMAGRAPDGETDYGHVIDDCLKQGMGVFAIRVFAGGALLDQPPSAHTLKTPYFPLALYERDRARAKRLAERVAGRMPLSELAVRFALGHPEVTSAIIGFGSPQQVDAVSRLRLDEPLSPELLTASLADCW
jgi:L-galactose dehydrogenase/L-glyceraldehyde 3-phosphate reductase